MKNNKPAVLHHKYSLEDGHVTPQISKVEGYRGIAVTTGSRQRRTGSPFKSALTLKAIRTDPSLLDRYNVKAAHVHHGTLGAKFLFLKEQHGIPLFVSFRGNDATAYPKKKKENLAALKQLFQTADRFFPVCNHLKQKIIKLGCPEHKIRVMYGGVDVHRFKCRPRKLMPEKKVRFLAIGRFVEKKGFSELIQAFAKVKKQKKKVKLTLIGQGPCDKEYRKLIKRLKLGSSVQLIPWVDYRSIHDKYHSSHIFCAPSCTDRSGNQEGIPNTLKEAMATGMPVIATNHAGIPELVDHKVSGLLVPEKSVAKLAKAMGWLADHPGTWEGFGRQARNKIETHFNMKRQLEKQKEYYDELLSEKQLRGQ